MFLSLIMPLIACKADVAEVEEVHDPIGRISGVVINEDGAALPDVLVEVGGITTHTNTNGSYTLEGVSPADDILVKFSSEGTTETYRQIDLHGWETATANAVLMTVDHTQVISALRS